jgi:DNA-directed RNA polymerase specialized sigma subunit
MTTDQLVVKATKAARSMVRRRPHGDDRYGVEDMIQDGCLAELQGRSAWYGVCDGLRSWLGRHGRLTTVPLIEALDSYYAPDPLRHLMACEQLDRHLARLDRLKPKQRCAYMLRRHEHKRVKEVAQILGLHPQRIVMIVSKVEKFMKLR